MEAVFQFARGKIPPGTKSIAEIGIGLGAFTVELMEWDFPLYLFEIDPVSCRLWRTESKSFTANRNKPAILWEGDCRDHLSKLSGQASFIFGNLPYYLTSEIITSCVETIRDSTGFLFLVQKEFADRMVNEVSSLSVFLKGFGSLERVRNVGKSCFYPSPKVDSTFVFWQRDSQSRFQSPEEEKVFSAILRTIFWGKRKRLSTSLKEAPIQFFSDLLSDPEKIRSQFRKSLEDFGWDSRRPEELQTEEILSWVSSSLESIRKFSLERS
jgi:16S rRNA (adenine1518-N6/adenine1519-N6)-dimethyltransferase